MPTNTIRLHRVLHAPADRVYWAFLDPEACYLGWQESLNLFAQIIEAEIFG